MNHLILDELTWDISDMHSVTQITYSGVDCCYEKSWDPPFCTGKLLLKNLGV